MPYLYAYRYIDIRVGDLNMGKKLDVIKNSLVMPVNMLAHVLGTPRDINKKYLIFCGMSEERAEREVGSVDVGVKSTVIVIVVVCALFTCEWVFLTSI